MSWYTDHHPRVQELPLTDAVRLSRLLDTHRTVHALAARMNLPHAALHAVLSGRRPAGPKLSTLISREELKVGVRRKLGAR